MSDQIEVVAGIQSQDPQIDLAMEEAVIQLQNAANRASSLFTASVKTQNALRHEVEALKEKLRTALDSKEDTIREARGWRDDLDKVTAKHSKELKKEKANHVDHKAALEKDRQAFNKFVDEPKERRKAKERFVVENKALQKKLAAATELSKDLTKEMETLKDSLSRVKEDLKGWKAGKLSIEKRCKKLEEELEAKKGSKKALDEKVEIVENSILRIRNQDKHMDNSWEFSKIRKTVFEKKYIELEEKYKTMEEELTSVKEELRLTTHGLALTRNTASYLNIQKQELEEELHQKAPLFEIGAKVRARFLAQVDVSTQPGDRLLRSRQRSSIVETGNQAAHTPNAGANFAMIRFHLWPSSTPTKPFKNIFQELYGARSMWYDTSTETWWKILNLRATIQSTKQKNIQATYFRGEADSCLEKLFAYGNQIEETPEVKELLEKLEEHTKEVVRIGEVAEWP